MKIDDGSYSNDIINGANNDINEVFGLEDSPMDDSEEVFMPPPPMSSRHRPNNENFRVYEFL